MKAFFVAFALGCLPLLATGEEVAQTLRALDARVLKEGESLRDMLPTQLSAGIRAANERSSAAWRDIQTKDDWEAYRKQCLQALRASLGTFPDPRLELDIQKRGEHRGDGYLVRNITYQSRPGLLVTANLYLPDPPCEHSPGIVISHSHHSPKTQGELQDMGILWARAGCFVLVPDHLGHGERRQHPFATADDYPEKFQVGRQDYYFRYNVALQLYVAGETLMGWMANDLMRGVDVLLAQKSIDPKKIILLGAVAGGGDPAGVTAALDERIAAVVPFNFGGPQPENRYPLPEDAESRFNYAGGGSWESTRNLYRSAADGFLPWVIVGSVAPRRLIHAHEFAWDEERDPVWKRYQRLFAFYDAPKNFASTHGYGRVSLSSSEASHCNNIGKVHRVAIHRAFKEWFGIEVDEERPIERHPAGELLCFGSAGDKESDLTPARNIAAQLARERCQEFERKLGGMSSAEKRSALQAAWAKCLGPIEPYMLVKDEKRESTTVGSVQIERRLLHRPDGIRLPLVLLTKASSEPSSVVLFVAQEGKGAVLGQQAEVIANLLEKHAVCLVDLRGTGETQADGDRGRRSENSSLAATALMLGQTLLGTRLADLRSAVAYLRARPELKNKKIVLYGDSLAPANEQSENLVRPLDVAQPRLGEPLGATLTSLAALYDEDIQILAAHGGLESYASLLELLAIHVPFDCIMPGSAAIGDLPLLKQVLADQLLPNAISGSVNGLNVRPATPQEK